MFGKYTHYSLVQCTQCTLQDDYGTLRVTYSQEGSIPALKEREVQTVRVSIQDQMLAGLDEHTRIEHINKALRETECFTGMRFSIDACEDNHPIIADWEYDQMSSSMSLEGMEEVYELRAAEQFRGCDEHGRPVYAKTALVLA